MLIASQLWVAAEEETRVSVLTVTVPAAGRAAGPGRRAGRRRRRGTAGNAGRFAWGEQMKAGKLFEVCSVKGLGCGCLAWRKGECFGDEVCKS